MTITDEKRRYELYERLVEMSAPERAKELAAAGLEPASEAIVVEWLQAFDNGQAVPSGSQVLGFTKDMGGAGKDDPLVGQRLGAYRLVARVAAEGGMGTVYRAERADGTYQQPVAVKVIRRGLDTDRFVQRFAAERQILARLNHPSIVRLLDAGSTDDGRPFLVMELVQNGVPLDDYARNRSLAIPERVALFLKVCAAVEYAHRNLVVHRDLKPANVLVTPDGEPKLLDFGLAKLLSADEQPLAMHDVTRPDERFMTPEYASPEQVRGELVLPASDVYTLGVMLFELLTGERPYKFGSRSPSEIERIVCETVPPRPSAVLTRRGETAHAGERAASGVGAEGSDRRRRQLEGDLDAIVLKALRKEPDGRYGSVEALAQDLRRHLTGLPVSAHAGSSLYRTKKFVARHRVVVGAAAAVFLTLAVGLSTTAWQARAAARARDEANAQRALAQQRFNDVRKLATNFIFDFHDAIASLAGATPARQMVVAKGLEYLDILSKAAGEDTDLELELAEAYDRLGEIQSNVFSSNTGNVRAGLASYERALAIRAPLAKSAEPGSALDLAYAKGLERRAEGLFANGRVKDGLTVLDEAASRYERARGRNTGLYEPRLGLARSLGRSCVLRLAGGEASGALDACTKGQAAFDAVLASSSGQLTPSLRQSAAMNDAALGNVLRLTGRVDDALRVQARALDRLRALIADQPTNATIKQNLAVVLTQYASAQAAHQQPQAARATYAEAIALLDDLRAADPADERIRSVLSFTLLRRSPTLMQTQHSDEARASSLRGLALLRAQAERPEAGPTDKNEYASWLLTCEPADLRKPSEALQLAQAAVAASATPVYLDTLALAYFQTNHRQLAIETGDRALAALPPLNPGEKATSLRAEVERHLAMFREPAHP